jgi:hypothetical protein
MSTLSKTIKADLIIFDYLWSKAYPSQTALKTKCETLVKHGVIQIESLYEHALAIQGRLKRDSRHGRDFVDGSDAKKATVQYSKTEVPQARIKHITVKRGLLRILVFDLKNNQFYFFKIPYKAYRDITEIKIPFTRAGEPSTKSKYWKYRVKSFKELASSC